jgi:hypothetical protein
VYEGRISSVNHRLILAIHNNHHNPPIATGDIAILSDGHDFPVDWLKKSSLPFSCSCRNVAAHWLAIFRVWRQVNAG